MSAITERARVLMAAATSTPWTYARLERGWPDDDYDVWAGGRPIGRADIEADAALIAAAPTLLAALCDESDALRAEVAALKRRVPAICEMCDGFGWHDAGDHGDAPSCADCDGTGATWSEP